MFAKKIIEWYSENGRNLPWRNTTNPYYIWLSEIILQQTRIEQGTKYYLHFINQYPTVENLANASEEQVLKSWQGLGYYSRARNLHTAAKYITTELNGKFPQTYEGLLSLKGVGKYTAAAIASFAYRLPYPVIDGNVYRLISRLYAIHTPIATPQAYPEFERILNNLIDKQQPDLFNQAIMDFGSTYCKPTGCHCADCIFNEQCLAYRTDTVSLLPVKHPARQRKERYFYYFDIRWGEHNENTLIQQRPPRDIWQGLYEFPLYEPSKPISPNAMQTTAFDIITKWVGMAPERIELATAIVHQLTHLTIYAHFFQVKIASNPIKTPETTHPTATEELKKLPISRLIDRYLSKM